MKTRARIDRKGVRMSWKTRARIVSERSENVMEDPRENCFTILKPSRVKIVVDTAVHGGTSTLDHTGCLTFGKVFF